MVNLIKNIELDPELTEYINKYAFIMEDQSTPIALFNESSALIYANTALGHILNSNNCLPTLDQLGHLFRGVDRAIISCIADNKSKKLNKNVKSGDVDQIIPYVINIKPIIFSNKSTGAILFVETDTKRLVNYFVEEKSALSNKISSLTVKLKNTFNLVNALFDNSPVGMMILDEQNRILQINKNGADILETKVSSLIGTHRDRFYVSEYNNFSIAENTNEEVQAVTETGKKKVLLRCSVTSEDEDEERFSVETFVDVSEIEKARVAAEESNKVKSEFLGNISHELRTPLHSIIGFSQCGIEQIEELNIEKTLKFFNKINRGGEILLSLVNDLLDVTALDSGKVIFNYKPIQFENLVEEIINEFDMLASSKGVTIRVDVKNEIKSMDMDEKHIQQVVRNIITNAIKFTNLKSVITIIVEQTDKAIQLHVYDQGQGIPEDELKTIFDEFTQSTRTNTGAGGTGLGLAICRKILEQHNGDIWAENNPDGGAVFIVNLYLK